jgi:hypothetical protein
VMLGAEATNGANTECFATGHWGCGAFGGDKQLKAIQQWISVSACKLNLHYFPFGDQKFTDAFQAVLDAISSSSSPVTVGSLTRMLIKAVETSRKDIFKFILSEISPPKPETESSSSSDPAPSDSAPN